MRLNAGSWRRSIFTRLILVFLIIMTPVYILGLSIYNWGYEMVEKEISNSMTSQIEFYLNTLEAEIGRIRSLQYECINDENLLYLVNASPIMSNYEETQAKLAVQKRLSVMKNSSIYIQNVSVHMPALQRTISAVGGVTELSQDWERLSKAVGDASDASIVYWKNKMYLKIQYPSIIQESNRKPLFIIEILLSDNELKNRLLMFTGYESSGSMLFNDKQGYSLLSNPGDAAAQELLQKLMHEKGWIKSPVFSMKVNSGKYLIVHKKSKYSNMELLAYTPESQVYGHIRKYQVLFLFFTFAAAVIVAFFSFSSHRMIHKPLKKLVNSFKQLEKGDLSLHIEHRSTDEFQYLYNSFNVMVKNLSDLIDQIYKQKILVQHAELKQLQSQINPHFLYNSFFILYRMAKDEDYDNIIRFSQYLAEYYHFITRSAADEVPLFREVTHARTYADIQSMRFLNRIEVRFEVLPEQYRELQVPRLILQPIIENAFEHGLKDNVDNALIDIGFHSSAGCLSITVEDNGSWIGEYELEHLKLGLNQKGNMNECTGIINIHRRIQIKFGSNSGLVLSRSALGGLKVEIRIHFEGEASDV